MRAAQGRRDAMRSANLGSLTQKMDMLFFDAHHFGGVWSSMERLAIPIGICKIHIQPYMYMSQAVHATARPHEGVQDITFTRTRGHDTHPPRDALPGERTAALPLLARRMCHMHPQPLITHTHTPIIPRPCPCPIRDRRRSTHTHQTRVIARSDLASPTHQPQPGGAAILRRGASGPWRRDRTSLTLR